MSAPLKVAVYSGEIPSTTFIERLIKGVALDGTKVLLFGILKTNPTYPHGVHVVGYRTAKFSKLWHLSRFFVLLWLFKPQDKKRLDAYLREQKKVSWNNKLKFYPVLWHQPDVFHMQWAKGLDDWMWVQEFGMKLVLSLRGAHINYSPIADLELATMYRKNFPKVDSFHAVSQAIAQEATKYGAYLKAIRVIKSGIAIKQPFKLRSFDSGTPFKIISVGRDHWIKNYRLAMDSMSILAGQGIAFTYTIIGVVENEALVFQRSQLRLEDNIAFVKALPYTKVQEAIQASDVLFLPSLEEGIANVVLEAMALGTLVVSTDAGGMAEVVLPNQTGFLVPARDAQAMADALINVSKLSLSEYQRLTQQASEFVKVHHTPGQMIQDMQTLYKQTVLWV